MDKRGYNQSGIPSPDIKQSPIIPLGNVPNYSKKNPTYSYGNYLNTETSRMPQLKTQPKLQKNYKESTTSHIEVASSWFSTEVDYTTQIGPKPTRK